MPALATRCGWMKAVSSCLTEPVSCPGMRHHAKGSLCLHSSHLHLFLLCRWRSERARKAQRRLAGTIAVIAASTADGALSEECRVVADAMGCALVRRLSWLNTGPLFACTYSVVRKLIQSNLPLMEGMHMRASLTLPPRLDKQHLASWHRVYICPKVACMQDC